ncbi:hypothetical protein [Streptosporangium sp. NPDC003464]
MRILPRAVVTGYSGSRTARTGAKRSTRTGAGRAGADRSWAYGGGPEPGVPK